MSRPLGEYELALPLRCRQRSPRMTGFTGSRKTVRNISHHSDTFILASSSTFTPSFGSSPQPHLKSSRSVDPSHPQRCFHGQGDRDFLGSEIVGIIMRSKWRHSISKEAFRNLCNEHALSQQRFYLKLKARITHITTPA